MKRLITFLLLALVITLTGCERYYSVTQIDRTIDSAPTINTFVMGRESWLIDPYPMIVIVDTFDLVNVGRNADIMLAQKQKADSLITVLRQIND